MSFYRGELLKVIAEVRDLSSSSLGLSGGTLTGTLITATPAAGQEALIIPHGAAPSAPTNGSIWSTTAGFFGRVNGATKTFAVLQTAQSFTARQVFVGGVTGNSAMATATGSLGELETQGNGTGAAMMSFHRPGAFAAYIGIDTDNVWKVGGWSMGANAYKIMHEGLASGTFLGPFAFTKPPSIGAANNASNILELGYTGGTNQAAGIDFHSSATAVDYDVRLITTSNGGVTGAGALTINATGGLVLDGSVNLNSSTKRFQLSGTDIPFHKAYESAQQTITSAGALTLAHGLGVKPKLYMIVLQCTTAEAGYSIGDEALAVVGTSGANTGASVVPDATNLNIRFGSAAGAFSVLNKGTGVVAAITNGNWKLVARAWA
jgi:hypothetical protein